MTWNCVRGERIRTRVKLWGDGCRACEKSACLTLRRLQPPGAASSVLFISSETFCKEEEISQRTPPAAFRNHLSSNKHRVAQSLSSICYLQICSPSPKLHCLLASPLPGRGSSEVVWRWMGWGHEWCHPSVPPLPQLLMYASGEPHELSNYWITAGSEVVTSETGGDSPSPFVSPLVVRRTFFLQDLWERGKGCAR